MSHRIECEECGATGTTVHKMCHGYWDEQTQRMEVFSECVETDWYCDECDTEVSVKEVEIESIVMATNSPLGAVHYITKGVK